VPAGHGSLHLPSPGASLRHLLPTLLEGVVAPTVLFYLVLVAFGFRGALLSALAWSYLAVGRRLWRRERPSGVLLLGTVMLTLRTVVSLVTGSVFIYFAQPTAGTACVALLFLGSALLRRPLTERLAKDFLPLDPLIMARPIVRRCFIQISLLWSAVLLSNAGFVMWLLLSTTLRAFVLERTLVSSLLWVLGVGVSTLWFVRSMRRAGIALHWGVSAPEAAVAT
jgi:hypothetical protein